MAKDYYKILGVSPKASQDDIKRAHRKLARKHHPDLNPGNKSAEEQFKLIQEAYDVLSDPAKRGKYDQFGEQWQHVAASGGQQSGPFAGNPFVNVDVNGGGVNFEEFIQTILGGGARRRPESGSEDAFRSAAPAEDVAFSLDMTLEEAFRGATKTIQVEVEDVCPECDGRGFKRSGKGPFEHLGGPPCPRCQGRGRIRSPRNGQVRIPPGAWDGLKLKLANEGAADAHGKRGDLYVQLHALPNSRFERDGQDLLFDVSVPFTVAALGGDVRFETLTGEQKHLVVPPGIQTGQKLRLSGQGMPALQNRRAGDALARVKITVPKALTDQERRLLEELARIRHDPIREPAAT